jgi:OOP family OmpA-OmpF porin
MKMKWWRYTFLILLSGFLVASCAKPYDKSPFVPEDVSAKLSQGYRQKVDNFLIILDTSGTMAHRNDYWSTRDGRSKLHVAKDILNNINQSLPGLKLNGGLRVFGSRMELIYGMTPHTEAGLEAALDSIKRAGGLSPLGIAINAAAVDLETVTGKTAVIIVSDGLEDPPTNPLQAVENMKSLYGDNVCIYPILVGDNPKGEAVMKQIAAAGECGFFVPHVSQSGENGNIGSFVEAVFLEKEMDDDGDGVVNSLDKCPNTPRGLAVDHRGCPLPIKKKVSIELQVQFDFDKAVVKPEFHDHLRGVANFLKTYPNTKVTLDGHTCWIGTEDYNQELSQRRAENVKDYLVDKFGIAESRLTTRGYGESQPVANNNTKQGRQQNRRVMAEITTVTKK